jgi:Spy/CpxP family protein refolding chaperone
MTRTKSLALAFYLGAVAVGAAAGITVDRWILRERLVNQLDDPRAMRVRLADELKLDASQRAKLDTILDTRNARYDDLMAPMRPRLDSVSVLARQQIRDLLTPEQRTAYDQMQREREAARRQEKKQ